MAVGTRARAPITRTSKSEAFAAHFAHAYIVLIGITTSFSVHFVGELPLSEIFLIGALPLLLFLNGRRALRANLNPVYALMALWLLGQMVADLYNHIAIVDRMRGEALIAFFGLDLLGMSLLVAGSEKRKLMYMVGLMIGALVSVKLQASSAAEEYPWKFGYAWGTMLLGLLVSSYLYSRRRYLLAALPFLALCGANLILNFRSAMLQLLIAFILIFPIIPGRIAGLQILPRAGGVARVLVLASFALAGGAAASALVHFVTTAGYISEEARMKNEEQSRTGNLLFGGRPEFVVGLQAALDAPIIGHGSWPNEHKYMEMFADMLVESGGNVSAAEVLAESGDGLIPAHSHIVGSWVWAGIFGLVFWVYIVWVVLRSIVSVAVRHPPLAPIYMWMLISMFWDIGFSPFASFRRIVEAFLLIVIADMPQIKSRVASRPWIRSGLSDRRMLKPTR